MHHVHPWGVCVGVGGGAGEVGGRRSSRTTMTTSTKAMTKVLMLCQGLVYDPKSISVETPGVLALRSGARRYSNELLRNRCAQWHSERGRQRRRGRSSVSSLLLLSSRLHCSPLFVHIQLVSVRRCSSGPAPVTPSPSEEDIN